MFSSFFSSLATWPLILLQNLANLAGKLEKALIPEQPPGGKRGQSASGKGERAEMSLSFPVLEQVPLALSLLHSYSSAVASPLSNAL